MVAKGTGKPHISDLSGRSKSRWSFERMKEGSWSTQNSFLSTVSLSLHLTDAKSSKLLLDSDVSSQQ